MTSPADSSALAEQDGNSTATVGREVVYIVDDDRSSRDLLSVFVRTAGYNPVVFDSAVDFLERFEDTAEVPRCLLLDVCMPTLDGLELQQRLTDRGVRLPIVFVSGVADVPEAVTAIKAGADDFLRKPVACDRVVASVTAALSKDRADMAVRAHRSELHKRLAKLTQREREVMDLMVLAYSTKQIATALNINPKTVFVHRGRVMDKLGVTSVVELSRLMTPPIRSGS